jgi:hypothetical protein
MKVLFITQNDTWSNRRWRQFACQMTRSYCLVTVVFWIWSLVTALTGEFLRSYFVSENLLCLIIEKLRSMTPQETTRGICKAFIPVIFMQSWRWPGSLSHYACGSFLFTTQSVCQVCFRSLFSIPRFSLTIPKTFQAKSKRSRCQRLPLIQTILTK